MTGDTLVNFRKERQLAGKASGLDATKEDLARFLGFLSGHMGREGGWIYDMNGRVLAHGWRAMAFEFMRKGWIKKSPSRFFIDWRAARPG